MKLSDGLENLVRMNAELIRLLLYLLPHIDAAERCDITLLVFSEHFAHGAGRRLTGEAVDIDLLLLVFFTHQLLLLLLWLYGHKPGRHTQ